MALKWRYQAFGLRRNSRNKYNVMNRRRFLREGLFVSAALALVRRAWARSPGALAAIYPDLSTAYREVFARIVEGIEAHSKLHVIAYPLVGNVDRQEMQQSFKRQAVKVVVALGRQGLKAALGLEREFGVIAGGVIAATEVEANSFPVFSMTPDPVLLFVRLKRFMPGVRRVLAVYDPKQSAWVMRLAREAARLQSLTLHVAEAQDLSAAVRAYADIVAGMTPGKDALWLPQDAVATEESAVMPLILEETWNRGLAVFSSNLHHVRRGALFALYADEMALGRQLALAAQRYSTLEATPPGLIPLREVKVAVNARTAMHLGMQLADPQRNFDLVFPLS